MADFFTSIFYQPILNILVFLYNNVSFTDIGVAIILLTLVIKLVLWPLNTSSIKSQKSLQDLQPKLDKLKKKYKDDKVALSKATMDLYKQHKVNPFSSCLPLLIQLPFLIAVFRIFRDGVNSNLDLVYSFIANPGSIDMMSLGIIDLSTPNIYLAVLAGLAQFWQSKMMLAKKPAIKTKGAKDENMAAIMSKQMMYVMPVITIVIGMSLPGGLTLYWFVLTLFTVFQQLIIFKKINNKTKGSDNGIVEGEVVNDQIEEKK
ncbi:MAG: YidC/Oxa1 family membrane protein insertase [Patescibacteria group bacterium]|jgi:YidC/Oxa1 family membrane protein insertase|nr:YidC/Oxa1 family membrane protein insertase [Patescibacteria group bacterium]